MLDIDGDIFEADFIFGNPPYMTKRSHFKMLEQRQADYLQNIKTQFNRDEFVSGNANIKVNENFSTQTCANCLQITNSSPKGVAGLGIREWICGCCGRLNDRDVNAAKNILRFGRETLAGGSPTL